MSDPNDYDTALDPAELDYWLGNDEFCIWCGDECPPLTDHRPYCSSLCAARAEQDSQEDYDND